MGLTHRPTDALGSARRRRRWLEAPLAVGRSRRAIGRTAAALAMLAMLLVAAAGARAQEVVERHPDLLDRPISDVIVAGHAAADDGLLRNNIRATVGDPYRGDVLREDVARIHALGRFKYVTAEAELRDDGTVLVLYTVVPQPSVIAVDTVGNKAVTDQELRALVQQRAGGPRDDYLIERAKRDIERLYRKKGYFLTSVDINRPDLDERGILLFRVIEGPRIRVRAVEFQGVAQVEEKQVRAEIKTKPYIFILRPGILDDDVLADDVAAIDTFYKDRGWLDVRVDREVQLGPDNREAKVVFYVDEGRRYVLRDVIAEQPDGSPLRVMDPAQVQALMVLRPGDVYARDKLRPSLEAIEKAYGGLGYRGVRVDPTELRTGPESEVDLLLQITEGEFTRVNDVDVTGNFLTRDKVVRRLLKFRPGRPLDEWEVDESRRRIQSSKLFNDVRVTVQDPDPDQPQYRDVLVEVKERDTGRVNFGVAFGSDQGVFGEISLQQDNFDVTDLPESFGEFVSGRAFRGAGQRFNTTIRPGDEIFQYSLSLTEPHFLDSDVSLGGSGSFRQREYNEFDETRITGVLSLSRAIGDYWRAGVSLKGERVELRDIEPDAPTELFLDAGPDNLNTVGLTLTRSTIASIVRPGRGSRLELSFDSIGLLGGEYEFFRAEVEYTLFLTLDEDFFGRRSILKLNTRAGRIFGADGRVPTYERFYLGGRSFRGFEFRTVAPKGIRADNGQPSNDPVGGDWLFFAGAQYEVPIFEETVNGVVFLDTGTVTDGVGFDDYRVSAGFGVRLYIPQLGPVPLAFDFGFPIEKGFKDEQQTLSFSAELPF